MSHNEKYSYQKQNTNLNDAIREGLIVMDKLVEILSDPGVIYEGPGPAGASPGKTLMAAIARDFESVYQTLYQKHPTNFSIHSEGTDRKGMQGDYRYALYNSQVISREEVLAGLKQRNHAYLVSHQKPTP